MWIVGAFLSILGLSATMDYLATNATDVTSQASLFEYRAKTQGELFHAYAEAVFSYVEQNPAFNGTVPRSSLGPLTGLPLGTVIPANWTNVVSGNGNPATLTVYVWAPPDASSGGTLVWAQQAAGGLAEYSGGSFLSGINFSGKLISAESFYASLAVNYGPGATPISLPVYIPNDSLVAVLVP